MAADDSKRLIVDLFAGPGGWDLAAEALGEQPVGLEIDGAACATRAAAGLVTIRYDVTDFPIEWIASIVAGIIASPVCTMFSAAGTRAGARLLTELAAAIRDAFAGRKTRALHRRIMAAVLCADYLTIPATPDAAAIDDAQRRRNDALKKRLIARRGKPGVRRRAITAAKPGQHLTREQRSARAWSAVRSASLVVEPARYIHACQPEWVVLEQVPEVLPLWEVYAAELRAMGYSVWTGVLNAADYGVPQTRRRAILIASRVRAVTVPPPTHWDDRQGPMLFTDHLQPWVSMADALGWGATQAAPVVTAGGTATGGADVFPTRARASLAAHRDAGEWVPRDAWVVNPNASGRCADYRRSVDLPSPGLTGQVNLWSLHRGRGAAVDRRDHPATEPAPAITGAGGKAGGNLSWVPSMVRTSFGKPARTSSTRPATTVQDDPRLGRPGQRDQPGAEQSEDDSVRITVEEAAALQSFPPAYPWQGVRTKQFQQVGNAMPPLLALHVLAQALGVELAA